MVLMVVLAGCGSDAEELSALNGYWAGSVSVLGGPLATSASFDYDEEEELLTGEVSVAEPDATHRYAVRRWEVFQGTIYLELTDVIDGTRGLDLDGAVDGGFGGEATVRYPCEAEVCGWVGTFELTSAPTPTGTTPPTTPPPTTSGGTGATTTPGGTGAPTTPGGTGAPTTPGGTGI